eukprot:TRINITY_DN22158_c0_g1_i1.p1 TRINITY_DN22158_c0_g1~~TRINITY_DN22158_c0_g1_i1.p1  ORF type:complete len:169 (+),score=28.42 TRINITY_DN22158_c0_g1_i1:1-507(+)
MMDQYGRTILYNLQGVPVHLAHQENNFSSAKIGNLPIYETIESDTYSESSSAGSEMFELQSGSFQLTEETQFGTLQHSPYLVQYKNPNLVKFQQSQGTKFSLMLEKSDESQRPTLQWRPDNGHQPSISQEQYENSEQVNKSRYPSHTEISQSQIILQNIPRHDPITHL